MIKEKSGKKHVELTKEEAEKLILSLAKQGLTTEKIGLKLKEKGANLKALKIGKILKENKSFIDADIENLKIKIENLKKHLSKHKHDYTTRRILFIKEAKLKKLEKYRK